MNIRGFLDDCKAEWEGFPDSERVADVPHPRTRLLSDLPAQIGGMSTENKLMLLNRAVANLEPDEVYVEVGCWRGLSLAGAGTGNSAQIFACDDFSQFGGPRESLRRTCASHLKPGQVQFFETDFRRFLTRAPWGPARVGVYFYDGGHAFWQQFAGLELMLPWLSSEAIIVVDDTNNPAVRAANALFAQHVPGFELVFDVRTPANQWPTWWNGIQVFTYVEGPEGRRLGVRAASLQLRRLFWDGVVAQGGRFVGCGRNLLSHVSPLRDLWLIARAAIRGR